MFFYGRLVKEPTIKEIQNRGIVYNNSIAVNRSYKKEGEPDCDFINIVAFGKTAEFMQKYMTQKGQQILVETHLQNRNWEDEKGQKHYATDFIVEKCYFADSKKETNQVPDEAPNPNFNTEIELKNTFGKENVFINTKNSPF